MGGTLFDTYPAMGEAFRRALADFGVEEPPADLMELLRVSRRHCTEVLAARYGLGCLGTLRPVQAFPT